VGCKVFRNNESSHTSPRFTLTMWDVKLVTVSIVKFVGICFTLTMWDVKSASICFTKVLPLSFTLTMWDVKQMVR